MDYIAKVKGVWYNDKPFKSKVEARWFAFYESLCEKVEYEPLTFKLKDPKLPYETYTPDFLLQDLDFFHEVKMVGYPSKDEFARCMALAIETKRRVIITWSAPPSKLDFVVYDIDGSIIEAPEFSFCTECNRLTLLSWGNALCGHKSCSDQILKNAIRIANSVIL